MRTSPPRISLAAGLACLLDDKGAVACFGDDDRGVLGRTSPKTSAKPLAVPTLTDIREVSVSSGHGCALRTTGRVACWGMRHSGELGDGFTCVPGGSPSCGGPRAEVNRRTPADVPNLDRVTNIAAGGGFTCALRDDQTLACWGEGLDSALPTDERAAIRTFAGIERAVRLVAAASHACVIKADGTVWCLGRHTSVGAPADPNLGSGRDPRQIQGLHDIVDLAAGLFQTCAVRADGAVFCWGSNRDGECGNLVGPDNYLDPVRVPTLGSATRVAAGYHYSCALLGTGEVWCWGSTSGGAVPAHPSYRWSSPPQKIALSEKAVDLVGGAYAVCAELSSGARTCWGRVLSETPVGFWTP